MSELWMHYGIKDCYMEVFIQNAFDKLVRLAVPKEKKQEALDELRKELPAVIVSTVWRINSLDPHRDTPVEILHVFLLGFVCYFWRDAVKLQSPENKEKLVAQISSLNVHGLGIPPLSGSTLVNYAGSLTRQDFHAIAQVASLVLYDLVTEYSFDPWIQLGRLMPMIWQPVVEDNDSYLVSGSLAFWLRFRLTVAERKN